jgi:hypothetical protein
MLFRRDSASCTSAAMYMSTGRLPALDDLISMKLMMITARSPREQSSNDTQ